MTKDELIRDLCSVEFRTKSKTRELVNRFIEETIPYNVSEWAKAGKERGYWDYFRDLIRCEIEEEFNNKVLDDIRDLMVYARKYKKDYEAVNEAHFAIAQLKNIIKK